MIDGLDTPELERVFQDYMREFKDILYVRYREDDRVASGQLINNIDMRLSVAGSTISVKLQIADYAHYLEVGRKAGKMPPIDKIKQWIEVKPVIPRFDDNGKLPTTNQLAFLIGRKIKEKGYEGRHTIAKTTRELNAKYIPLFKQALEKDFQNFYEIKVSKQINSYLKQAFG